MYRVLLVEDDAALRYIYSRMKVWKEEGFVIEEEAANGKEAMEWLGKKQYDVIMTDIRMPFVDGLSLLEEMKGQQKTTYTILVSSHNEFEYARKGMILGAADFLVKPVTEGALRDALHRAKEKVGELEVKREDNVVVSIMKKQGFAVEETGFLREIATCLWESMEQMITIEEMASYMKLSKDYFGKVFKQQTNMTVHRFYLMVKIEYAKQLLDTKRMKNYEISEALGFASPDYFTKVFKEETGKTPTQYKQL